MYAVENGGDGTRIDLAAYKTGIGSGAAGAKIAELSTPTSLSLTRRSGSRAAGFFYRHQIFFGIGAVF
jgi:hypothetical protein